jgi:amino acid transporter
MPHGLAHAVHFAHAVHLAPPGVLTAAAEPIPGLSGGSAFALIAIVVVVIAAVAIVPLILDVRRATAWRQQITDQLIERAADDQEVRDLLRDLREPRGVRGLTRSVIAVLILALVGLALAVAMLSSGPDSGDLRKTIVTSLMTVLATVAGFYFGSLGAQNSAEDARRHAGTPGKPGKPGAAVAAVAVVKKPGGTAPEPSPAVAPQPAPAAVDEDPDGPPPGPAGEATG